MNFRSYEPAYPPFIGTLIGCILLACCLSLGCYGFKGITIPAEASTFYVGEMKNRVPTAPSDLGQNFSERLKQKFLNETRLNFFEVDPDMSFTGEISRFAVRSVAPQPGETTAFNRLDIAVKITYEYALNEDDNWENTFSFYADYDRDDNLLDVQDGLIDGIFEQLTEDIFNKAFTNW